MAFDLIDEHAFLPLVHGFHGLKQEHFRILPAHADHRANIFGKTGAAVTDAGKNKMRADAAIQTDRPPDFTDVGVHLLAQTRHFIDERNLGRKHCVGSVFAHLGAAAVHNQNRIAGANERLVKLFHRFQCFSMIAAQHDTIRFHEIFDRGTLF